MERVLLLEILNTKATRVTAAVLVILSESCLHIEVLKQNVYLFYYEACLDKNICSIDRKSYESALADNSIEIFVKINGHF